ncbi:MAG: ABC transporter ATP-binding protein/permease [Actinobacteria bacterium]|nr:ABC transporter ATP-binding protein/permease [Actinomycetota bacterium]
MVARLALRSSPEVTPPHGSYARGVAPNHRTPSHPVTGVDRRTVRRVVRAFVPYRFEVAVVVGLVLLGAGVGVVNPLLIKVVFDTALFPPGGGGPDLGRLGVLVAIMVSLPVVGGALGLAQTWKANVVGQRVMRDLREALFAHLQRLSLRFFTDTRTGEIQSRLANDVGGVQRVVTSTLSGVLSNVVSMGSALVAMAVLSWPLTLLTLITVPVFGWLSRSVGERRRRVTAEAQETMADVSAITQETLSVSGIVLSKLFGRSAEETARFQQHNERLADLSVRQEMIGQSFYTLIFTFLSATPALVYLVAGLVLAAGGSGLTAGTVVAFTTLQTRLFFPFSNLLQVSVELRSSLALFDRIFAYLDLEEDIVEAPDAVALPAEEAKGHVAFRHVRFRYDDVPQRPDGEAHEEEPDRGWALDGVDFEIHPGQLAAFVGPSGAGKSTIASLIPRLYDVQGGAIEIDGIDVRRLRTESLAALVGFVTQESYLFHGSVGDNLRYGKPDATDEELEAAAGAAFILERIRQFPEGFDTKVGERGYRLSGGEKQRIAIARVILHDPRILILDEATSALDTASERIVQAALEPLMRGRTTIAVAHRLSTIRSADVIFAVDRGRIVEHGGHDELLRRGGLYARLYDQQFDSGRVEAHCADGLVLSSGEVVTDGADLDAVATPG